VWLALPDSIAHSESAVIGKVFLDRKTKQFAARQFRTCEAAALQRQPQK
jgi:hypothetical protein